MSPSPTAAPVPSLDAQDRYIDLLRQCLTRELFLDQEVRNINLADWPGSDDVRAICRENGWRVVQPPVPASDRAEGRDYPPTAETMAGTARLINTVECCRTVLDDSIPGDFIETGVWRGGNTILMRGILAAYGDHERRVWVADSFEGLPPGDGERFPADAGIDLSDVPILSVSADQVRANFARYGLLDDQVQFLEGWFSDTLATAPIDTLSVLRLDGDLYQSTIEALTALFPKLSVGGFVIIDDYGAFEACQAAVHDYRAEHGIDDEIIEVDWTGAYWRRTR